MQELNRQMMALPELRELEEIIRFGTGPAAVSGVSVVHRAMLGAALRQETKRPLAVLCADEQEARRMAADLAALTGEECVTLFAREWQLRDRVSASHSFEQERLDALCRMAFGRTGIVVATVDGMMQRTLPPTALRDAVLTLRLGEEHDLRALAERLTAAGYVRCEQVEGAGQFAVRGGILDVYSPMSAPVRVEFFDTEIDAMGEFDVATQRRTKNLEELTVLPAAEVLPFAAEGGRDAMLARMEHAAAQLAKKETTEKTAAAIRADMDRLREGLPLGGMDRYLAAAYPTAVCAADYLPEGSIVLVCEGSRVMERAKGCAFEWGEDLKILLEEGVLAGQFASLAVELEDLTRRLRGSFPLLLCDSLPTSRYLAPPRAMLSINARQLPSYGGSLETAAADMEHYLAAGSGVLVLCGNETRAKNFHRLLEERGVKLILVFCTGALHGLHSNVPMLEPNQLLRAMAPLLTQKPRILTLTPSETQVQQCERRWKEAQPDFEFTTFPASPYLGDPFTEELVSRINAVEDADLVIMDCLGFSAAMRDRLQARINKNILLPRSLLFRVACELLGI